MKTEQPVLITSITASGEAGATISKNLLINFTGALLSNGAKQLGVCNADTYVGEQMPVMVSGIALIKTYAAITIGAALMCGDEGKVSPKDVGGELVGYALDASLGANELIRVKLV